MKRYRHWMVFAVVGMIVLIVLVIGMATKPSPSPVNLTKLVTDVEAGRVHEVELASDGTTAQIFYTDDTSSKVTLPAGESFFDLLKNAGIPAQQWPEILQSQQAGMSGDLSLVLRVLTFVAIGGFVIFFLRRISPGGMGASPARKGGFEQVKPSDRLVTFDDVAGAEEVKAEVADIIDFLREPDRYRQLGARIPRGLLLTGPPGTGKTLITRALAGEAHASFFSASGSEFVELYVGVGASRVRELFKKAKEASPAIIFIDEIDAIGRRRGRMEQSSEYDQTLNQILVEMDGFEERTAVVVVAATNRADILDPALLRPGRFDRKVLVDLPDRRAREAILGVHARGKPLAEDVSLAELAARTPGMTGADLSNVINEAAILTARDRRTVITYPDLLEALDRTLAGPARNSRRFSEEERRVIAYHEAGHAVVAHLLPHADTVRKVSIVSRGQAGGFTMIIPDQDRGLWTRNQLNDRLAALLGGLAAEETVFGDITTGSSNDLEQVTQTAAAMVQRYGMSQRFGLISIGSSAQDGAQMSQQTAFTAEQETLSLVTMAHETALHVLQTCRDDLERVAQRLLEVETIEGDELAAIIQSGTLPERPRQPQPVPSLPSSTPASPAAPHGKHRRAGRAVGLVAAFARAPLNIIRGTNREVDRT